MSQKKLRRLRQVGQETIKEVKSELLPSIWDIVKCNWKYLLILSLITIGLYANAMNGDFVSDDYASITQESQVGNFKYMFLSKSSFGNSQMFTTYLIYKIFGNSSSIPYHIVSLMLFMIFNVIAFVLIKLVVKNDWVSRVSVLLFNFMPIHVEAISWISGRIYLLLAIFICLSFMSFIYFIDKGKYKYLIWSGLFFMLGFLTDRPRPFAVILLAILYVIYLGWARVKDKIGTLVKISIVIFPIAIILAIPYAKNRIGIVNSGYNASDSIFYNPFFQYPTSVTKYLQLLWYPSDLTLYHTMYILPNWLNWLILLNYLALVVYFFVKDKRYFFALAFIFLSVAPSLSPIKVSWLVAERYMFLGSLGFALLLGLLIVDHFKKLKIICFVGSFLFITYGSIKIIKRNINWQTNHNLWVDTCYVSPNSHNAWNNIGDDYDKLASVAQSNEEKIYQYSNAIKGFTQSVLVKPNYADAYHNRANIFYKVGRLDLARESYETALKFSPGMYQTYLSLTQIDLMENKKELALTHARNAVQIQPSDIQSNYALGIAEAQNGNVETAKNVFKQILSIYPDYQPAKDAYQQLLQVKIGKS